MVNLELKKSCNKITVSPFSYSGWSMSTVSWVTIGFLLIHVVMLAVTESVDSILVLLSALVASVLSETIYYFLINRKKNHSWRISVIQGLLIGLLLPSTYPVAAVFVITLFALVVCRWAFGDFSESWVNFSAICVILLYFVNSTFFPQPGLTIEDLQSRNAALILVQNGTVPQIGCDASVTEFLNRTIFKFAGISIPEGYISLFWDNGSAIPAFRFNLITLISSIVLISFDFIQILVPSVFLLVYGILVRFLSPVFTGGTPFQGDILLAFLTSGTLFCTLYILQWYGTLPISFWGKVLYGFMAGVSAFMIMGAGVSSVGYVMMVLVVNIISPCIQFAEDKKAFSIIHKMVIPKVKKFMEYENA